MNNKKDFMTGSYSKGNGWFTFSFIIWRLGYCIVVEIAKYKKKAIKSQYELLNLKLSLFF